MMKAILNHVIVRPIEDNKTSSGLIIPNGSDYKHPKGEVVSAGDCSEHVKPGDVVLHLNGGTAFDYEGENLLAIGWGDIISIL